MGIVLLVQTKSVKTWKGARNDMGDLEQFAKKESKTTTAIFDAWKMKGDGESVRGYLGASILGHHCGRYLWYLFRWCGREAFSGRMYRLFDRGDVEEARVADDLKLIGCEVHTVNPDTGKQFEVSFSDGHGGGHMDGCVRGIPEAPKAWHVLEVKTHNARSFRDLIRHGVQGCKPMHYIQMQVYMLLSGMDRALYVAVNKDDDDIYTERCRLDKEFAQRQIARADRIVEASQPPMRAGENAADEACKWCPLINLCHGNPVGVAVPCEISCRSCVFAAPETEGHWVCRLKEKNLSLTDQHLACDEHLWAPGLVTFSEFISAGKSPDGTHYVEYMNEDNTVWRNGPVHRDGQYTSKELTKMPQAEMAAGAIEVTAVKRAFNGEVVS